MYILSCVFELHPIGAGHEFVTRRGRVGVLSVVWGGRGCTCTVVKLLTRRGCKGELFGKRRKGELEGEGRERRSMKKGGESM